MRQAKGAAIKGEAVPCTLACLKHERCQAFKSGTVCYTLINRLGQTQDATGAQEACTFDDQRLPAIAEDSGGQTARVDEIKGAISKIQRFRNIHDAKRRVGELLSARSGVGVVNHSTTDVNTC